MSYNKPLPDISDPVTGPYWAALNDQKLTVQRCARCGYLRFPPGVMCPECMAFGGEWIEVPAVGTVWSYAVYHRALDPAFKEDVPYTVAMVDVDAGFRMPGMMIGVAPGGVNIGDRVEGVFEKATDEVTVLRWALEGSGL